MPDGDREVRTPVIMSHRRPTRAMHVLGGPDRPLPVPRGYVLPLLERREEWPTTSTFRFSTEGTGFQYLSNQAIRLALPGVDDPWGAVRTFSLSSSPSEANSIAVTCKISETPFKQALARLRPGDPAQVYGPIGRFLFDPERPAVFVAGGIGITPFRGMIRYAVDEHTSSPLTLIYSARVPEELVFRAELDALAAARSDLHVHYTVTRPRESLAPWLGRTGRIDRPWLEAVGRPDRRPRWYLAGLPEMVRRVEEILTREVGVPPEDVDFEVFRGF